jgi:YceI-like domain
MSGMRTWLAAAAVGLMAACASPPPALVPSAPVPPVPVPSAPVPPAQEAPPGFPEAYYRDAAAQGTRVLRIDPAESRVVIEVRRGGSLARLGHDHVIASHDVEGYVAPAAGRADLYLRFERMIVDEPQLRAEAGFDTQPTTADIAGTRRNMLSGLEADTYPFALVGVTDRSPAERDAGMLVTLTLHGVTRVMEVPVQVERGTDGLAVTGQLFLKQTDFGITPLSVLGGAIQVQDAVTVRFRIRARAVDGARAAALGTAVPPWSGDPASAEHKSAKADR